MARKFFSAIGASRSRRPTVRRRISPRSALIMLGLMIVFSYVSETQKQPETSGVDDPDPVFVSSVTAEGISLVEEEKRGGHTIEKHVAKTDDELRTRLRAEPWLAVVSTFTDLATAERCVNAALLANAEKISAWSEQKEDRDTLAIAYRGSSPIGRSLRRGAKEAVECTDANIVLRPDRRYGHIVLTAYPETSRGR